MQKPNQNLMFFLVISILVLVALACGSESPTKTPTIVNEQEIATDVFEPTDTPIVEEQPTYTVTLEQIPNYQIVQKEDVSYTGVVRLQFRILVDSPQTETQLRQICEYIIETEEMVSYNAISFMFYLPDTDMQGSYTAGMAIWAPDGKWENASQVSTGDYSRHKLSVEVGNALGNTPTPSNTGLSEEIRRQIFFDLVTVQDSGAGDEEAFEVVAKKYGVTTDVVREIAIEGVIQGWPMP